MVRAGKRDLCDLCSETWCEIYAIVWHTCYCMLQCSIILRQRHPYADYTAALSLPWYEHTFRIIGSFVLEIHRLSMDSKHNIPVMQGADDLCVVSPDMRLNEQSSIQWFVTSHVILLLIQSTVYPKKYAHGFCFAVLCCGYTLTDFPISIRLTSLALWQSNDCPSASKATLMNMDKYFMWIHYERLHNHNKAKHNKTVWIFLGIYCRWCRARCHHHSIPYTSPTWCHTNAMASPISGHSTASSHCNQSIKSLLAFCEGNPPVSCIPTKKGQ